MSESLDRLAERAGIEPRYYDYWGRLVETTDSTKRALLAAMGYDARDERFAAATLRDLEREDAARVLPPVIVVSGANGVGEGAAMAHAAGVEFLQGVIARLGAWKIELENGSAYRGEVADLPLGYHRLLASDPGRGNAGQSDAGSGAECALIVTPSRCYLPESMAYGRIWALSTQLYALRSAHNWGIGDFGDLGALSHMAGGAGARAVGLNPLHELYPSNPESCSPYSPSSRLFLDILYIDVERVPELRDAPEVQVVIAGSEFRERLDALRFAALVDYRGVAELKLDVLARLHRVFRTSRTRDPNGLRALAFREFVRSGGEALQRLAVFEALAEFLRRRDSSLYGWQSWPAEYRSPSSSGVGDFAREHDERIEFFLYVQWLAAQQLADAATAGRAAGAALYRDLAVGSDLGGADAWADRETFVTEASLGAPADMHNDVGQYWGLAPLSPRGLRASGYRAFASLLLANMRNAAILRIDHVMALQRCFWIPRGASAREGAYVRYPLEEMLGVAALESVRHQCAVVGEDLGTVPEGFRERMQAANVLSSRVLYFERNWNDGTFLAPDRYPRLAAASVGTHDLPTLAGWWTGDRSMHEDRARDRHFLVEAFEGGGAVSSASVPVLEEAARDGDPSVVPEIVEGAARFLAEAPSVMTVVAIEDVLGEREAVNVPGTVDEHPNWRRKRPLPLEALASDGRLARIGRIIEEARSQTMQSVGR